MRIQEFFSFYFSSFPLGQTAVSGKFLIIDPVNLCLILDLLGVLVLNLGVSHTQCMVAGINYTTAITVESQPTQSKSSISK